MPFSKESVEYFTLRNNQLASLKHQTKIGIFGSFSKSRKAGLLALKKNSSAIMDIMPGPLKILINGLYRNV